MSELKVNTIESNNTLTANSLTVGNTTINATGITAPSYVINTSAVAIGNSSANVIITANISIPSIVLGYDPTTNIFPSPGDIYQWASGAPPTNCTLSRDNTIEKSPYGGIPFKITPTGADPYPGTYIGNTWNLAKTYNGDVWKISGYIRANTPLTMATNSFLLILPANSNGTGFPAAGLPNTNPSVTVAGNTWTYFEQTFSINGNSNTAYLQIRPDGYDTTTPIWYDGLTLNNLNNPKTTYTSFITETVNTQLFTANGTWTKPSWATDGKELVIVHMWGGGGGGYGTAGLAASGGGGGAFVYGYFIANNLSSTQAVIVGGGGAVRSNGENSSFANLFAYGGGGGGNTSSGNTGGGGGGWLSAAGTNPLGGDPLPSNVYSTFGGGHGANSSIPGASSVYGGGGGGKAGGVDGGNSIYGGGGGNGGNGGNGGISIFGGNGGTASAGSIPGGGGSGIPFPSAAQYPGARGEVRVYTFRIVS